MKRQEVFKIYLAYPTNRTNVAQFKKVIKSYRRIGTEIRAYLIDWEKMDGLPRCDLYNPADHELFVSTAYKNSIIEDADILATNCEIISGADLLVRFGTYRGRPIKEVQFARANGLAVYTMPDISEIAIRTLRFSIVTIIKARND